MYAERRRPFSVQKAYQYGPCGQDRHSAFPQRTLRSRRRIEGSIVATATPALSRRARARMNNLRSPGSSSSLTASIRSRSSETLKRLRWIQRA